jgi:hypothetical protein
MTMRLSNLVHIYITKLQEMTLEPLREKLHLL